MANSDAVVARRMQDTEGYSGTVRSVLALTAFAITLLPIPVVYFGIFPIYESHGWFLIFYTPFICLLTLCYLFYVRDWLARGLFENVLNPPPPPDPYYPEPLSGRVKRVYRQIKRVVLGVLPALLVMTSMYCVARYFTSMEESVAVSSQGYVARAPSTEDVGALPDRGGSPGRRRSAAKPGPPQEKTVEQNAKADSLPSPTDSTAVRHYVLQTSKIDAIPGVVELTVLYVGAFVALLAAVTLMALKEYAKEALGLSEHELMFGRYPPSPGE